MHSIRNFKLVRPDLGTSGQPTKEQFECIANQRFQHVVNLAMPDHPESIADEAKIVSDLGMDYHSIPVPFNSPDKIHLTEFTRLLDDIYVARKSPVYIHCIMNYRVSAFTYHYQVHRLGVDKTKARQSVFSDWEPDEVWTAVFEHPAVV